ncbi:MAG: DUF3000 family protein [Micrococcaceae bacterium]
MNTTSQIRVLPQDFQEALDSMRGARYRHDLKVKEISAPTDIAPYAVALEASVYKEVEPQSFKPRLHVVTENSGYDNALEQNDALVVGRFILLYHPEYQEAWDGHFRITVYVRGHLDDSYTDNLLVTKSLWAKFNDAMIKREIKHRALGGTVTKISTESFGSISNQLPSLSAELRASWTAVNAEIRSHLEVWSEFITSFVGEPAFTKGVIPIPIQRNFSN